MGRSRRRTRRRRSTPRTRRTRRRAGEDASLGGDGDAREGDAHPAELQGDAQAGEEEALAVDEEEEGHGGGSSAVEEVAPGARGDVDGEEGAPRAEERRLGQLEDVEDVDDHEPDEEGAEDRAAAAPDEHRQRGDERQTRAEGVAPRAMDVQERRPRGRGGGVPGGAWLAWNEPRGSRNPPSSTGARDDGVRVDRRAAGCAVARSGTRARDRPRDFDNDEIGERECRWPPRARTLLFFEVCRGARGATPTGTRAR